MTVSRRRFLDGLVAKMKSGRTPDGSVTPPMANQERPSRSEETTVLNVNCPMCEKQTPIVDGEQQSCAHCQSEFNVQVSVVEPARSPTATRFPEDRDFAPPPAAGRSRLALGLGTAVVGAGVAGLLAVIAGLVAVVLFLGAIAYAFLHLVTLGWL